MLCCHVVKCRVQLPKCAERSFLCHEECFSSQVEPPDAASSGYVVHEKGVQHTMPTNVLPVGSLVDVTSYGPFRGLKGNIQAVNTIADESDELFCFYLVALEGTQLQMPIWFEHHEVEPVEVVASLSVDLQGNT